MVGFGSSLVRPAIHWSYRIYFKRLHEWELKPLQLWPIMVKDRARSHCFLVLLSLHLPSTTLSPFCTECLPFWSSTFRSCSFFHSSVIWSPVLRSQLSSFPEGTVVKDGATDGLLFPVMEGLRLDKRWTATRALTAFCEGNSKCYSPYRNSYNDLPFQQCDNCTLPAIFFWPKTALTFLHQF